MLIFITRNCMRPQVSHSLCMALLDENCARSQHLVGAGTRQPICGPSHHSQSAFFALAVAMCTQSCVLPAAAGHAYVDDGGAIPPARRRVACALGFLFSPAQSSLATSDFFASDQNTWQADVGDWLQQEFCSDAPQTPPERPTVGPAHAKERCRTQALCQPATAGEPAWHGSSGGVGADYVNPRVGTAAGSAAGRITVNLQA